MPNVPSPETDLNWQNQFKQKYKTPRDLVLDPNFHGIEDLEVRRDLLKTIYPDFEKIDKESQDLTLQQNYKYWQKYYADKDAAAKPKEPGILEKITGTIKGVFAPSLPPPPSGMGEKVVQPKKKEVAPASPAQELQTPPPLEKVAIDLPAAIEQAKTFQLPPELKKLTPEQRSKIIKEREQKVISAFKPQKIEEAKVELPTPGQLPTAPALPTEITSEEEIKEVALQQARQPIPEITIINGAPYRKLMPVKETTPEVKPGQMAKLNLQRMKEGKIPIPKDRMSNAVNSFFQGIADQVPMAMKTIGSIPHLIDASTQQMENIGRMEQGLEPEGMPKLENSTLFKMANEVQRKIEDSLPVNPKFQEEYWASMIPQGLGSTIGFIAMGMMGGEAGLPAAATTMAAGALVQAGSTYEEAYNAGANPTQLFAAFIAGVGLGSTEALPIERGLSRLDKISGGWATRWIKDRMARGMLSGSAKGYLEEFGQEWMQNIGQDWVVSSLTGEPMNMKENNRQGIAGGVSGAAFSAFTSAIGVSRARSYIRGTVQQRRLNYAKNLQEANLPPDVINNLLKATEKAENKVIRQLENEIDAAESKAKAKVEEFEKLTGSKAVMVMRTRDPRVDSLGRQLFEMIKRRDTAQANGDETGFAYAADEVKKIQAEIDSIPEAGGVIAIRNVAEAKKAEKDLETAEEKPKAPAETLPTPPPPPAAEAAPVAPPVEPTTETPPVGPVAPPVPITAPEPAPAIPTGPSEELPIGRTDEERRTKSRDDKPDRRKNLIRRKQVSQMTREEIEKELLTDELTQLRNRSAWERAPFKKFVASLDLDKMKKINDVYGQDEGDRYLQHAAQGFMQSGIPVYRLGGDDFVTKADTKEEIDAAMAKAQKWFEENPFTVGDNQMKVGFAYGIEESPEAAFKKMKGEKAAAEDEGKLEPRYEKPESLPPTPETITPTPETPEETVPERPSTILSQIETIGSGNRQVVFVPESTLQDWQRRDLINDFLSMVAEIPQLNNVDIPGKGTFFYHPNMLTEDDILLAVEQGQEHKLMGILDPKSAATSIGLRAEKWNPDTNAWEEFMTVVSKPEHLRVQLELLKKQVEGKGKFRFLTGPAEDIAKETIDGRKGETLTPPPKTIEPQEAEIPAPPKVIEPVPGPPPTLEPEIIPEPITIPPSEKAPPITEELVVPPTPPAIPPTILDIIPEPPAEKEPAQPEEITRDQQFRDLLSKIKAALVNGAKFNNPMLQAMANESFGGARGQGKYTLRDMYDVFEGAVSEYIEESGMVDFNDPIATMARLEELQGRLAVQSDRTTEQIELQQFSTPPMQAFLTAYALGNPSSPLTALEPSAGTGMLATMMRIRGYQVRANEIDERRVTVLKLRGFPTSTVDALHLTTTGTSLSDYTPDVILMNPPFSAGPGKLHGMEFGARHVMNALQKLAPGGRLVAIVGEGMGHHRSKFNRWWNQVQAHYNVRADLGLKGQYYQKMGTTYDNRMIVIDKTGPTPGDTGAERSSKVLIAHQLSPAEALEKLSVIAGEDIYGRITRPSPIESIKAPPPIEGPVIGPAEPTTGTGSGSPGVTGGRPGVPSGDESRPGELGHVPESGERGPGGSLPGPPPIDIERKPTDAGEPETTPGLGGRPGAPTSGGPGDMAPIEVALDAQDKALGEEETDAYVKYKPKKAVYKGSKPHPAELIESATLGSVESPDIKVKINLPPEVISDGRLSDAQLETITYAVQRLGTTLPNGDTAGFWIGDGTGVGKGREIAGIIYHYLRETGQKKAVWISATQQLYEDAKRDIGGVGVPLSVIHQNESKFAKGAPIDSTEGILFTQYGTAASNWKSKRERFNQIIDWLQPAEAKEFDGVIVFDECFTYETLIKTDRGEIPIGEIVEKQLAVKVLSYNKECNRYEWKPVLRWLPRTINSSLVKITHEYGSFTCTPNHKIWNQKDRKYVLAGELSPGMFLLWQPENKKARQENQPPSFLQHELSKELLCTDESSADLRLVRDPVSTQCERIEAKATSKILQMEVSRSQENGDFGISRVVSIEILESGDIDRLQSRSAQDRIVYDLEVADNHNYFADGILVSNCHAMKNAVGTNQGGASTSATGTDRGEMGLLLARQFPKAKILYVSATGATLAHNMGYMNRLGLWGEGTAFADFDAFMNAMNTGGLGAMEMLSRDLKSLGAFISRQISYRGVNYDYVNHDLNEYQLEQYNKSASMWSKLIKQMEIAEGNANQKRGGTRYSQFYSTQQRFFLMLMTTYQMQSVLTHLDESLKNGMAPIINILSTNETLMKKEVAKAEAAGKSIEDIDIGPRQMIKSYIENWFPLEEMEDVPDPDNPQSTIQIATGEINQENLRMQEELLNELEYLNLPDNPMDMIANHLGGWGKVAEVSGRTERIEGNKLVRRKPAGKKPGETINNAELRRFQNGEADVLIITGAGSAGISAQAEKGIPTANKRRIMYCAQLSWSADQQMQFFGRAHRSNQVTPPIIMLVKTNVAGQQRLINAVSRRLASLGAVTQGNRESLGGSLFDIEDLTDGYGRTALMSLVHDLAHNNYEVKGDYGSGVDVLDAMGWLTPNKSLKPNVDTNVEGFLNRIMVLPVDVQNDVFNNFYGRYQAYLAVAKEQGTFDTGISKIRGSNIVITKEEVIYKDPNTHMETKFLEMEGDFKTEKLKWDNIPRSADLIGFVTNKRSGKISAAYNYVDPLTGNRKIDLRTVRFTKNRIEVKEFNENYKIVKGTPSDKAATPERLPGPPITALEQAKDLWEKEFAEIPETTRRPVYMVTGAVFPIHDKIIGDGQLHNLKIVRAVLADGSPVIGIQVKTNEIGPLKSRLGMGNDFTKESGLSIFTMVRDGATIELDNNWRIQMTPPIHGERRMEINLSRAYREAAVKTLKDQGAITEIIVGGESRRPRVFVPLDDVEGPKLLDKIFERNKPVRVIPTGTPSAPGGGGPTSAMSIGLNVEADGSRSMEVGRGDVPQSIEQARQAAEFWLKQAQESIDRILNGQGTLDDQMIVHQNPVIAKHLLNWIKTQDNTDWLNERIYVDKVGQEVSDHVSSEVDFDNTQAQAEAIHYFPYVEEMMDDLKRSQEGEEIPQPEEEPTSAMASSPGAPVLPAPPQTSGAPNYAPPPVINKKDLVRRNDILINLAKKLKVPIRYGRFRQRALGIFKINATAIRIKKAQDVAVAAHEVGHAINKILWGIHGKQLNWRPLAPHRVELEAIATKAYAGQSKLPEGFAEYIRYWITDPAQAAQLCPGVNLMFEGELARNPDLAGILKEAQRDYKRWLDQTSSAKILSHISVEEPVYDQMGWFEKIYTGMVNHLNPINEAVKIITKGRKIPMEDDPGKLAQALSGWAARAEHFLQVGTFGKNLDTLLGPGLKQILEPMKDRLDDLRITAIALRTLEKKGLQGIEVGITVQEAKESLQEQGFDLSTLTVGSTPTMLGHPSVPAFDVNSLKAATPEAQITKDTLLQLYKYQDQLLIYFRDCGMLSVDQYISIKLLNQFFVPFHRMYEAGAGEKTTESRAKAGSSMVDLWQPVKKMKGSWRPIIDPLESIIKNTYTLINVAERNLVGQALANLTKEDGSGRWVSGPLAAKVIPETFALDRIKNALSAAGVDLSDPNLNLDQLATIFVPNAIPSPKENIITVYFKGKPILYQLEPNLYNAIKGLDKDSIGILMKIAAIPASVLRMGATGINPEFASRNIARDMLTAWAQTNIGYIPGYHTLQGLGHVIMKDKDYQEWMRSGGPHSAMASMDRKEMSMALRDLMSGKMEYALRHPIDALRILSEISEAMTRVSIYTQTRKRGGSIREAGLASREGTLDFQRIGAWARGFNLTIPFFNASIQDVDKFVRVHKFNPKGALLKGAIFQAISILVYYLNKDDERYREAPWWLRDLFWLFPTKGIPGLSQATPWIPVPKPFSWGMFYATPAERLAEYIDTKDPTAFDNFIKNLISNITPGIVPTIAKTPFELMYNKNFFTNREIESDWMQKNYLPEYRSNWYTSEFANQTALLMAKMGIHVSPVKIEHAMFSTFGGSARLATKVILDPATNLISPPKGKTLPTTQLADVPLIRSIAVRFPHASLRSISKVYDLWTDINLKYRSRKQSRKEGNRFDLPPFTPQERKMYDELRYATERFKSINREIHRVIQDPKYSADEKRRRIDNAYMRMLATAQKSLKKLGIRKYKEESIGLQSPPDDTSGSLPEPPED
jgi:GGDEF domain-containing protein